MTYSYDDQITLKKIHLTQGRLLRASILATFALKNHGFATARVTVDTKTNTARVMSLYVDAFDKLHGAPFVSPVGYGFFVQHGTKDEVLRVRVLPTLSTIRNFDESLCQ